MFFEPGNFAEKAVKASFFFWVNREKSVRALPEEKVEWIDGAVIPGLFL